MSDKIDMLENASRSIVQNMIEKGNAKDSGKVALRINNTCVIMVNPEKATQEYRAQYIEKMHLYRDKM